jgi:Pvc16 N-terminal domain
VIDDLDRSIETLLRLELPPQFVSQVEISFATPDDSFPPTTVTPPAIDLFLYDIRENRDLRTAEWSVERSLDGTTLRAPPVRVDCSYLVTAWASESSTSKPQDEHRMLGEVMRVLLRHSTVPAAALQGELVGQAPPLPSATLQPGRLQSVAEFWQALGGKPKASLNYTVTISVEPVEPVASGPPVLDKRIGLDRVETS